MASVDWYAGFFFVLNSCMLDSIMETECLSVTCQYYVLGGPQTVYS